MGEAKWLLVGLGALALWGCRDAAAPEPAVPARVFSFKAQNEIQQADSDFANAQVGVMFSVSLPDTVSATDLARIQSMDVLWANNYVRTPIQAGFQVDGDSLRASQLLTDRTDGLPLGTYTLEVQFADGQQITRTQYCDGNLLYAPDISSFTVNSTGVRIAWYIYPLTGQSHYWRLFLERVQPAPDTVLLSLPGGYASGGVRMNAALDYAFQPDEAYALVLDMENACNHREIRFSLP